MKKVYIRWLGSLDGFKYEFSEEADTYVKVGRLHSLKSSFEFELSRKDEAACELLVKENGKLTTKLGKTSKVGLAIRAENVFREFRSDVWSYYGQTKDEYSRQHKTQNPERLYFGEMTSDREKECWAHMGNAVSAIIVYGKLNELRNDYRQSVIAASRRHGLPIWQFVDGKVIK
jgi:hypothetical protein